MQISVKKKWWQHAIAGDPFVCQNCCYGIPYFPMASYIPMAFKKKSWTAVDIKILRITFTMGWFILQPRCGTDKTEKHIFLKNKKWFWWVKVNDLFVSFKMSNIIHLAKSLTWIWNVSPVKKMVQTKSNYKVVWVFFNHLQNERQYRLINLSQYKRTKQRKSKTLAFYLRYLCTLVELINGLAVFLGWFIRLQ